MSDNKKLEFSEIIDWLNSLHELPPYGLTIPSDKVIESEHPKPTGKIFWNDFEILI